MPALTALTLVADPIEAGALLHLAIGREVCRIIETLPPEDAPG